MKKVLFIGLACFSLTSCSKECNCGTITNDEIILDANNNTCYTLTVRNSCSGNSKTWCFDYSVWFEGNVGENFCVTNVDSW
jgi:hypothetical protein